MLFRSTITNSGFNMSNYGLLNTINNFEKDVRRVEESVLSHFTNNTSSDWNIEDPEPSKDFQKPETSFDQWLGMDAAASTMTASTTSVKHQSNKQASEHTFQMAYDLQGAMPFELYQPPFSAQKPPGEDPTAVSSAKERSRKRRLDNSDHVCPLFPR